MGTVIGFDDLKVGQRVKVKGTAQPQGRFMATKISIKTPKNQTEFEGLIQNLDPASKSLRLVQTDFVLPANIDIFDLHRNSVRFDDLKVGEMVKITGKYENEQGFMPKNVKMKETMWFDSEELQGKISAIEQETRVIQVAGHTILVSNKTAIEGFA